MIKLLDLYWQYQQIQSEIDSAITKVIESSRFIGGQFITEFENAFATYQQAGACVGVANGTDAIEIALEALDLGDTREVLVPANSFIASSEAVTRAGHRVVFCDCRPESYLLDLEDARRRLTDRSAAIIAVHLYGHPCDMDAVRRFAGEHGLRVIEDCAQAHGAEFKGKRLGTLGDIGCFSFYPGKNLGAYGDGGAIVTDDADLALRCRMIANHGRIEKYDHLFEGRNSRLDSLQAAILAVKLRQLDSWIAARNRCAAYYAENLVGIGDLRLPCVAKNVRHAFHLYVVQTEHREALRARLTSEGIESGIHYPIALPDMKAYEYLGGGSFRASVMAGQVLSLPIGEHLTESDLKAVVSAVQEFFA